MEFKRENSDHAISYRLMITNVRDYAILMLDPEGRRRSWPMTKKQCRTPNVGVGTGKKSIAATASRWFLRNVSHRSTRCGSRGACRIHRETLLSERSKPSFSSSP